MQTGKAGSSTSALDETRHPGRIVDSTAHPSGFWHALKGNTGLLLPLVSIGALIAGVGAGSVSEPLSASVMSIANAFIDGYSFARFFRKIFLPLIAPGIGVSAFFCFTFSWVELILAKALTITNAKPVVVTLTVGIGAEGVKWGLLAAAGVLTIIPGAIVVYFVRNSMAKGFSLGRV